MELHASPTVQLFKNAHKKAMNVLLITIPHMKGKQRLISIIFYHFVIPWGLSIESEIKKDFEN